MPEDDVIKPSSRYTAPQSRVLTAALNLFCEHGIAGTSLQMIANETGVTKAAIYHQFPTKEEIVVAIGTSIAEMLDRKATLAETQPTKAKAREVLIEGLIRIAVSNRRVAAFVQNDPAMVRFIREHKTYRKVTNSLNALLLQGAKSARARTAVSMIQTAIGGAVLNPLIQDLADDELFHCMKESTLKLTALIE